MWMMWESSVRSTAETVVYEEDFNATNGSFVAPAPKHSMGVGVPTTTFPALAGRQLMGYSPGGNYTASTNQTLASPAIDLSGVVLRLAKPSTSSGGGCSVESNSYDDAWAEISTDGTTWTTMWPNHHPRLLKRGTKNPMILAALSAMTACTCASASRAILGPV